VVAKALDCGQRCLGGVSTSGSRTDQLKLLPDILVSITDAELRTDGCSQGLSLDRPSMSSNGLMPLPLGLVSCFADMVNGPLARGN
jgi:hypothetical protein